MRGSIELYDGFKQFTDALDEAEMKEDGLPSWKKLALTAKLQDLWAILETDNRRAFDRRLSERRG